MGMFFFNLHGLNNGLKYRYLFPRFEGGAANAGTGGTGGAQVAAVAAAAAMNLTNTTNQQDLASLFECPVCFDYVLPPILQVSLVDNNDSAEMVFIMRSALFQCHAGHLVCSSCRPKLTCCPTCRGQLGGNIRNLAMEKVASTVMFPCKYQQSGTSHYLHTQLDSIL